MLICVYYNIKYKIKSEGVREEGKERETVAYYSYISEIAWYY